MVIFHSYVSLPEGMGLEIHTKCVNYTPPISGPKNNVDDNVFFSRKKLLPVLGHEIS